VSAQ